MHVIKRDGSVVPFDPERIRAAIEKAFNAVDSGEGEGAVETSSQVASRVLELLPVVNEVHIETIQDTVERALMEGAHFREARAYILYREKRAISRGYANLIINVDELAGGYLRQEDWRIAENANVTYGLMGFNNYMADAVTARLWLHLLPPEVGEAHVDGAIHVHDLGIFAPYCCGWDLQQLLDEGFGGAPGKVVCKPPRHFRTALGQLVNFLYTMQGESAGAQAVSNFDTLLAAYVREDGLDYYQVLQAIQEFVFNMNVPTRIGGQSPFSNITLDMTVPEHLKDQHPRVAGRILGYTYADLQEDMDLINEALAQVLTDGDASGRPFTFPIPTYNIWRNSDLDEDRWQPIFSMAASTGLPYFANFMGSDMNPEDVRSMCCRLRLDHREMRRRLGGLFGSVPLTGSLGVVTVNLARAALMAHGDEDAYFRHVERLTRLAATALIARRKVIDNQTERGLYPYSRHYLAGVRARNGSYWGQHFLTIGLCGAHEAAVELVGDGIEGELGYALANKTLALMRGIVDQLNEEHDEHHYLFNLEATPAEGASYRLAKSDAERFPGCTADRERRSYTGSTLLPADSRLSLSAAIRHQAPLQTRYSGGTVFHVYLGQPLTSGAQARRIVEYLCHQTELPYITLSPVYSICREHGRLPGEQPICHCGRETEVWSRIVGYYRPVAQWNPGKVAEHRSREYYEVEEAEAAA